MEDLIKDNSERIGSDEFQAISDVNTEKIPTFGIAPTETLEKSPEELEAERLALEEKQYEGLTEDEIKLKKEAQQAELDKNKTTEQLDAEKYPGKTADEIIGLKKAEADTEQKKRDEEIATAAIKKLLQDAGVESVEELKRLKNPPVPETDLEKAAKAEKRQAAVRQYAVDNDIISLKELDSFNQLSVLPAADLVFADFANEYKGAHEGRKDENGAAQPVTDEEIREAFQDVFHTESTDPGLKKVGERLLNSRAKEILEPAKQKLEGAAKTYEGLENRKLKMPEFKSFVQGTLKEVIPPKYEFEVDGRKFSVELDGKDFTEIEAKFKNDAIYENFYSDTNRQGLKTSMAEEVERQIAKKYLSKAVEVANRLGFEAGQKAKAVGSHAPFDPNNGKPPAAVDTSKGKLTEEEKQAIRDGLN